MDALISILMASTVALFLLGPPAVYVNIVRARKILDSIRERAYARRMEELEKQIELEQVKQQASAPNPKSNPCKSSAQA
jgi:hypothetical protein